MVCVCYKTIQLNFPSNNVSNSSTFYDIFSYIIGGIYVECWNTQNWGAMQLLTESNILSCIKFKKERKGSAPSDPYY
jgi:hypothetical protein